MKYFLMHFPIILHNGLQKTVSQMYFVLEGRVAMGQGPITFWPEARGFFEGLWLDILRRAQAQSRFRLDFLRRA